MKSAFEKVMAGIEDVTAYAKGDGTRANVLRPVDIKAIRVRRNMIQGATPLRTQKVQALKV